MASDDPIVLTYRDAKLISSDLAKLRGTDYLSDSIIHFFFSHLSSSCPKDILLVKPAVSFWLANSGDLEADFRDFAENNQFGEKQVVIFTVNDNQDMRQYDGGNHWSLLVYYRKPNAFVHYDSVGGLNNLVAWKFYGAVKKYAAAAARQTPMRPPARSIISKHLRRPVRRHCHHINKKKKKKKSTISGAFVMMGRTFSNKLYRFRNFHKEVFNRCRKKYLRQYYTQYHTVKNIVRRATDTAWNKVSSVMENYLVNNNGDDEDTSSTSDKDDIDDPWFREERVMPQQTNCYDCGLYVMSVARVICQWYSEQQHNFCFFGNVDSCFPNIMKNLDNSVEHTMRPELLNLIYSIKG